MVATTDCVRAVPEMAQAFVPEGRRFITFDTDGFGRGDTLAALSGGCRRTPAISLRYGAEPASLRWLGSAVASRQFDCGHRV